MIRMFQLVKHAEEITFDKRFYFQAMRHAGRGPISDFASNEDSVNGPNENDLDFDDIYDAVRRSSHFFCCCLMMESENDS